jgi:hypothetical protein
MVVAIVALLAALGGSALAGGVLNKKKVNAIARNQAESAITRRAPGLAVNSANTAGKADSANTAGNAGTLGGLGPASFGPGVVNGGLDSVQNGGNFRTPYGVTTNGAVGAGLEAIAPVVLTLRDFEAQWVTSFDGDDTVAIGMQLNDGSSLTTVPLCTIVGNATQFDCKAAGPVQIAKGDLYKLDLNASGLEGNEQATFAYRLSAG